MIERNRRANKSIKKEHEEKKSHREVSHTVELPKKDVAFKNTLIIVLLIICLVETIYVVFFASNLKENSVKKSFLTTYVDLQKNVSTYLSNKSFELYEAYNYAQILTGTIIGENEEKQDITDINGEKITPLVSEELKMEMGDIEYYAVNIENVKDILKVEIPSYLQSINWYIGSDGSAKIKCNAIKPRWWTPDLDGLILGN